jgi:hypothetical protein
VNASATLNISKSQEACRVGTNLGQPEVPLLAEDKPAGLERQLAIKDVYEPFNCDSVHTLRYGTSGQPLHCYLGFSRSHSSQE